MGHANDAAWAVTLGNVVLICICFATAWLLKFSIAALNAAYGLFFKIMTHCQ
jgi:uncharacterized membrane protein